MWACEERRSANLHAEHTHVAPECLSCGASITMHNPELHAGCEDNSLDKESHASRGSFLTGEAMQNMLALTGDANNARRPAHRSVQQDMSCVR